ncbi:unnamed protein product [Linum tenue]|uniref:Uncharacterized protein n=1 Tax=Linum tenue TaxID=586396 RepID=A0AAV0HE61_9ROSI|nr:unnamed protein product [Linum tenue]
MLRTRLVWFTVGFSLSGAAIAQFIGRDLWAERVALSSHVVKQKMETLEARVSNLESITPQNSTASQAKE